MPAKKLLILLMFLMVGFNALIAFAGGPEEYTQTFFVPVFRPSMYIEGYLGYAAIDWKRGRHRDEGEDFDLTSPFDPDRRIRNRTGGFTGGGDLGFRFLRYLSAELGAYSLPEVKGFSDGLLTTSIDTPLNIHSSFAYAAGRLMVNLYANIDVFGKVGVAIRGLTYNAPDRIREGDTRAVPMLATGLKYQVDDFWMLSFQYIFLPSNNNERRHINVRAPDANLILVGLGYAFPL